MPKAVGGRRGQVRSWGAGLLATMLGACAPYPLVDVPSENQGSRIRQLVLHFTSEPYAEARRLLTEPTAHPVSAHYLVPEPGDPTRGRERVVVHRLVPEARRAWHAGASSWDGETALNNSSIGVEIVNVSRCEPAPEVVDVVGPEDERCRFLPYPEAQLEAVVALARDILARNPDIEPWRVVGHADVAPARKADPGPRFPWRRLHEAGVGAWYEEATLARQRLAVGPGPVDLLRLQRALAAWGYALEPTGELDPATRWVVRAFHLHFRPEAWQAPPDGESLAIVLALLERYRPERLAVLEPSPVSAAR